MVQAKKLIKVTNLTGRSVSPADIGSTSAADVGRNHVRQVVDDRVFDCERMATVSNEV